MDTLDFGSLAHIRILLLPVGSIKRPTFDKWAAEIKHFANIRLGDIPADKREEKARFMPNPLAAGHIHLSYPSHPPPTTHLPLSLFRPSDFPLGVIGVATCSATDSLSPILAHFNASISELFPPGNVFPLANNCFVFEESDGSTNLNLGENYPGMVVIPSMMGNKKIYVGTLLADLCSNILAEFSSVVQSLESPLGNEYLNAGLFPTLPPSSEMPKPIENDIPMRSSLPPLPTQHSQPDLATGSPLLRVKTPNTLSIKRNSSFGAGPPVSPYRHSSLPVQTMKKRTTAIGAVSSHGRLFKVFGDLFLLAGRTMDASVWYNEAIAILKGTQDIVWQASALEGLATIPVLDAWSASQGNDPEGEQEPWSEVADKLSQAVALYHRATPSSDTEAVYPLLSYLYTRAVLRHTSMLFSIWSAKGWGPLAFITMLQSGMHKLPPTLEREVNSDKGSRRISYNAYERLTIVTGITRATIANILAQAHGPWLLHLGPSERIAVLESVASVYGMFGYKRKEAYILREVLGCVMDLVVCGREENGSARVTGAGLGIQGLDLGGGSNQGSVGVRANDLREGNESVLRVVKHVCKVHGIDLEAVSLLGGFDTRPSSNQAEDGDQDLDTFQEPYGWPELQIGIVREAIAVAEALPDYPSVAQFSLSALKTLHRVMSQGDQHHLYNTANRALATAKRRGDTRLVDYWTGQPIVSIEVIPLPLVRLPLEKPTSLLSQAQSTAPTLTGMTDPFLYNPRRMAAGQSETMLVQNEAFEVIITLRNPFVFDLELSSLTLSTSGVAIQSKPLPVIVPANSFHPVTISGQAVESGPLTIRGCIVQAPGGAPREFVLPVSTEDEEIRRSQQRSALECESERLKYSGLDSRPWEKQAKRQSKILATGSKKTAQFLRCKVVPEQPLLRIRRTSLTHGAVMLYNGEKSTIHITLENVSSLPVDFIRLTFDDSTIAPAQQALAEGDLSVFDTYETEYELLHRPVFTWSSKRDFHDIGPGGRVVVSVTCFGKVNCTNGVIHISYSYYRRPQATLEKPLDIFHTRQLSHPVLVTVYRMLECHGMDILPYSPFTTPPSLDGPDDLEPEVQARRRLLTVSDPVSWCLFSVEVRNTYGVPFVVTFDYDQHGTEHGLASTLVPPGSTSRVVLPVKKIQLSEEHTSKPIPTLSDRQFVVINSNLTAEEEKTQRELFWYREELFKSVRGRWKETGGSRHGELSLRQLRMSLPMLKTLRVETVRVEMSLCEYDDTGTESSPVRHQGGHYKPPINEFVCLRVRVKNLSPSPLTLIANLKLEPAMHMLHEGVLSDIPIGVLDSGSSHDFELPVSFLSCGVFQSSGEVYILGQPRDRSPVGRGELSVEVTE